MNICIFGASSNLPNDKYFREAAALGRLIALQEQQISESVD